MNGGRNIFIRRFALLALSVALLGGCAGDNPITSEASTWPTDQAPNSLRHVRYSEVMAWQMAEEGRLLVELNNPRRTYILELVPSCVFELRQATDFIFSGKSPNVISVNDDVMVGNSRCRIVGIYETDQTRQPQVNATKRMP